MAYPYAVFRPADKTQQLVWQEGKTFRFAFKLFGFIPFGIHSISVREFDRDSYRIYTNEGNRSVPVWNHKITLEKLGENRTAYTDEVEIGAGWKTPFVYLWAKAFYAHRQRKWIRILKTGRQ